jgi:phage shock protein A
MGLFSRFKRAVKANINDMISKAENPQKMLNQLIVDMNGQLIEAKKTVAASIADEKKLERQAVQNHQQAAEWERKAVLAVKAGKDDLAKEALLRKQEYEELSRQYHTQWEAQHASVEELKSSLRQLQQKIEEAQRKKNILLARAKRAEAQQKIQQTMGGISDTSAFDALDRMTARVDQIEAEAEAMRELDAPASKDSLEAQFAELEVQGESGDRLLEQLKARMLEDKSSESPEEKKETL